MARSVSVELYGSIGTIDWQRCRIACEWLRQQGTLSYTTTPTLGMQLNSKRDQILREAGELDNSCFGGAFAVVKDSESSGISFHGVATFIPFTETLGYQDMRPTELYSVLAKRALKQFLEESGRTYVRVWMAGSAAIPKAPGSGRESGFFKTSSPFTKLSLLLELDTKLCPETCKNFITIASRPEGSGGYIGSHVHRLVQGGWVQMGDTEGGSGNGGSTASGEELADECFHNKFESRGVIGMANGGVPHSASSQFFISLAPAPYLDNDFVAFGRVVDGDSLLDLLEKYPCDLQQRPVGDLTIVRMEVLA